MAITAQEPDGRRLAADVGFGDGQILLQHRPGALSRGSLGRHPALRPLRPGRRAERNRHRSTPVVDGDRAFVEWWGMFDCAAEEYDRWRRHFEKRRVRQVA